MSSITVQASYTYGHNCKTLNEVGEHWTRNLSCDILSFGHPPYLDRTSVEKFQLHDISFRYNNLLDQAIITHSGKKWFINDRFLCKFGIATLSPTPSDIEVFRSL